MDTETTSHCLHTQLPNGIYEFVFLTNSRKAVDDFCSIIDKYFFVFDAGEFEAPTMPMLIELREFGIPPVAYLAGRYRDIVASHSGIMPGARVAYLYRGGLISIMRAFFPLVPDPNVVHRRFFHVSERAQAEAWLLDDNP